MGQNNDALQPFWQKVADLCKKVTALHACCSLCFQLCPQPGCTKRLCSLPVQSVSAACLCKASLPPACAKHFCSLPVQSVSAACLCLAVLQPACAKRLCSLQVRSGFAACLCKVLTLYSLLHVGQLQSSAVHTECRPETSQGQRLHRRSQIGFVKAVCRTRATTTARAG